MEKTWDEFWASGKVTDYLAYRDAVSDGQERQDREKYRSYGTTGNRDGHGFDGHAR